MKLWAAPTNVVKNISILEKEKLLRIQFGRIIYICKHCEKILDTKRHYCGLRCRRADKNSKKKEEIREVRRKHNVLIRKHYMKEYDEKVIVSKNKIDFKQLEVLTKRLSSIEQEELTIVTKELSKLTQNPNYFKCACCNKEISIHQQSINSKHHIIPRKYGGTDDEVNKINLCFKCHDIVEIQTENYIEKYKHYDIETLKSLIINNGF